jgi:hypothetical protein
MAITWKHVWNKKETPSFPFRGRLQTCPVSLTSSQFQAGLEPAATSGQTSHQDMKMNNEFYSETVFRCARAVRLSFIYISKRPVL